VTGRDFEVRTEDEPLYGRELLFARFHPGDCALIEPDQFPQGGLLDFGFLARPFDELANTSSDKFWSQDTCVELHFHIILLQVNSC